MNTDAARDIVVAALKRIVPDADLATMDDDAPIRSELELDSLDFLSFVELLSSGAGRRIEESDYLQLRTLASCAAFLSGQSRDPVT